MIIRKAKLLERILAQSYTPRLRQCPKLNYFGKAVCLMWRDRCSTHVANTRSHVHVHSAFNFSVNFQPTKIASRWYCKLLVLLKLPSYLLTKLSGGLAEAALHTRQTILSLHKTVFSLAPTLGWSKTNHSTERQRTRKDHPETLILAALQTSLEMDAK